MSCPIVEVAVKQCIHQTPQIAEDLVLKAHADAASGALEAVQQQQADDNGDRIAAAAAATGGSMSGLRSMNSDRRHTVVKRAVAAMAEAPNFVILDFR